MTNNWHWSVIHKGVTRREGKASTQAVAFNRVVDCISDIGCYDHEPIVEIGVVIKLSFEAVARGATDIPAVSVEQARNLFLGTTGRFATTEAESVNPVEEQCEAQTINHDDL